MKLKFFCFACFYFMSNFLCPNYQGTLLCPKEVNFSSNFCSAYVPESGNPDFITTNGKVQGEFGAKSRQQGSIKINQHENIYKKARPIKPYRDQI